MREVPLYLVKVDVDGIAVVRVVPEVHELVAHLNLLSGSGFRVPASGCRVQGFRYQVVGVKFQVEGFRLRVEG